jgi:DNA repair protein RecN (Recombination protein N)
VSREGRSQRRVNGRPVTQGMLADIGEYLVDIHGQHEHQALLKQQRHIEYLDNFAGEEGASLKEQVNAYYRRLSELEKDLKELRLSERERARRLDLLEFQAQEIDAARLLPGEDLSLAREHDVLASAGELYERSSVAYSLIHGEDHGIPGVIDRLASALEELEPVLRVDDTLRDAKELLQTAQAACEEASREIRVYRDGIDQDPGRLAEIEGRLSAIQRLKTKYGDTVDEILDYRQAIGEEIARLESSAREIASIDGEIAKTRLDLGRVAEKLRNVRMQAAEMLRKHVSRELQELAMDSSVFEVDFREREDPEGVPIGGKMLSVKAGGVDTVEFLLSANPGEPPKPLVKIQCFLQALLSVNKSNL